MEFIYQHNGLPFYTEEDIRLRNYLVEYLQSGVRKILHKQNSAWKMVQIEAPTLIPRNLVSANYTADDFYVLDDTLALKPETTPSSYLYAEHLFEHQQKPPLCVWQASKSYRKEQDQATTHCRFKEFYQIEFQCIYSEDTKNNYQDSTIDDIAQLICDAMKLPTRVVLSDRLPSYSMKTLDVELFNGYKWMEVCSVSLRTDFKYKPNVGNKTISCLVLEIAIGLDRLVYNGSINPTAVVKEQIFNYDICGND